MRRKTIEKQGVNGHTVMTVRLTNAEFLEFSDQVEACGLSNNRALRIAARRIGGFLEIDEESQKAMKQIARQLNGIAANVNQLAKIAKSVNNKAFLKERTDLGEELAHIRDMQKKLLNVARRRKDGWHRLEDAM